MAIYSKVECIKVSVDFFLFVLFDEEKKPISVFTFIAGHYYGTPRPSRGVSIANNTLTRRSNSANDMFQRSAPESSSNDLLPTPLSGELITSSLRKSQHGFGFTIIGGVEKGQHFLQIKDVLPDGPAAKDGQLHRGDILVYINDSNVMGYSHNDVLKIFQAFTIGDMIQITVCRGYPLAVNFDDPHIDVVSLNGVHHLPNGGYKEYQPENHARTHVIKIRKGDHGFGFTVADSPSGQRVKAIVDRARCQNLCEHDLLLSINGQDLFGKQHADVVDMLMMCPTDTETTFVVRRGKLRVLPASESTFSFYRIESTESVSRRFDLRCMFSVPVGWAAFLSEESVMKWQEMNLGSMIMSLS